MTDQQVSVTVRRPATPSGGASEYALRSDPVLLAALHGMPLFEAFSPEQLRCVASHSEQVSFGEGETVFREGCPGEALYVLIEGEWRISRIVGGFETTMTTTSSPGTWSGWIPSEQTTYTVSTRATKPSRLLRIPAADVRHMLTHGYPIASHLVAGVTTGMRNFQAIAGQQEKLAALGKLSAGLAHELNNPAAAGRRAARALRDALDALHAASLQLGELQLSTEQTRALDALRRDAAARASDAAPLGALEQSDREDELAEWLDGRGLQDGWELAPTLASAGLDLPWLEDVASQVPAEALPAVIAWLRAGLEAEGLVGELEGSTRRISELVGSVKEYTYMDQAPVQEVDIHQGLESTLTMLGHKLKRGIEVVREYDRTLPRIPAHGSDLNQVWTNLIDNAADAMEGRGALRLRTARDGDRVLVEVADTGPGIPESLKTRIWEPFFTAKGVGEGTGLGLDTAYRIVVSGHRGEITVSSRPGDTRFQVRLPLGSNER